MGNGCTEAATCAPASAEPWLVSSEATDAVNVSGAADNASLIVAALEVEATTINESTATAPVPLSMRTSAAAAGLPPLSSRRDVNESPA